MEKIRKVFTKLPAWSLSVITTLAILWLTLAPKPLGDEPPSLFPGADKLVHGIMFGGLAVMILLDWQRKRGWRRITFTMSILTGAGVAIFGFLIEMVQDAMRMGRGFEYGDIIADTLGSFLFASGYQLLQNFWLPTTNK